MGNLFTKEWLQTNKLGGFASSTVEGANTRRYHGLLVASLNPPTDRKIIVSKIEERLQVDNNYFDISTNQYPDIVYPKGAQYLKHFTSTPFPNWIYEHHDWKLEKNIIM